MVITLRLAIFVLLYTVLASTSMYSAWQTCFPAGHVRPDLRFSPGVKALVVSIVEEERKKRIEEWVFHPPMDVFLSVNESALLEHRNEFVLLARTDGYRALIEMLGPDDKQIKKTSKRCSHRTILEYCL